MRGRIKSALVAVSSYLLGGAFLLAALAKIVTLKTFAQFVAGIKFMPPEMVPIIVVLVPAVELAVGVSYFQRRVPGHVQAVALALLGAFLAFQCAAAIPSLRLAPPACPCFGELLTTTKPAALIARGAVLLSLGVINVCWTHGDREAGVEAT